MACDPNYADDAILLHCDGTNGSTSFPDSSPNNLTVTASGGAQVDTAAPLAGTGSLLIGTTGGKLSTPCTLGGPLDIHAGDFTIEFFLNPSQITGPEEYFEIGQGAGYLDGGIMLYNPGGASINVQFIVTGIGILTTTSTPLVVGTWVHVAFYRAGNNFYLSLGGVVSHVPTSTANNITWPSGTNNLIVGSGLWTTAKIGTEFDEIRVTKGLARYGSSNFTPPAVPFGGSCVTTVPNVVGELLSTGESDIVAASLVVGSVTQTSDPVINNGFIINTSPVGGTPATAGDTVDIIESNSATVPDVTNELLATGESDLVAAGFAVGSVTVTTDPVINTGHIISTSPSALTRATFGDTVGITESNSATVPSTVNTPLANAESAITGAGFSVGSVTTQFSLTVPGGYVISTNPVGGVRTVAGTSVDIVESDGPGTGTVPNVLNISESLAVAAIEAAGFTVGTVAFQPDAIIIAGNIDAQNPAGGTTAFLLSPVNITVSSGLPSLRVPDLFGLTQSEATILLGSLGLVVGAVGAAPSTFIPPGTVMTQNASAGTPVAAGTIVSFVLSLGTPAVGAIFDFEATVISQYANSPTILQIANNLNQYIDQSANFANFYNYVWNVDTAVGFGLDVWGKIVGVSRLLQVPNTTDYVGFFQNGEVTQDWQPMGSDQPPQPAVGGAMYTGHNATETYLLDDNAYRQLILAKAFANICTTTAPAINQILQNLYGPGTAWVLNEGPMAISYNLTFTPTAIQLAILEQSGVIPTPPGVSFVINTGV